MLMCELSDTKIFKQGAAIRERLADWIAHEGSIAKVAKKIGKPESSIRKILKGPDKRETALAEIEVALPRRRRTQWK